MKSRSGKVLRDPQPSSIDGILRVWEHGALVGEGTARGALLADSMGLGKTASAVIAASRARLHRVLVVRPEVGHRATGGARSTTGTRVRAPSACCGASRSSTSTSAGR